MKKLLTLFATGLIAIPSFAQYKQLNAVNVAPAKYNNVEQAQAFKSVISNAPSANRGSALPGSWMNYVEANVFSDYGGSYNYYPTYQDSTLSTGTVGSNLSFFGFGFSFDPTSQVFYGQGLNPDYKNGFQVKAANAYTVDSVEVTGYYDRKSYNNYTDTLYIEVASTNNSGTYSLYYRNSPDNSDDDTLRLNTAIYDATKNSISDSVVGKITVKKILNAAAFADSSTDGFHHFRVALPSTLSVPAGRKVVAFSHFASGHTYALNTPYDSANIWYHETGEALGSGTEPKQISKESNIGLIMTAQLRYASVDSFGFAGHRILVSTAPGYQAAAEFDYPNIGFHVVCATCSAVGIANINNTVKVGDVYPNPANNSIIVPLLTKETAVLNISISNTIGQVVATQNLGKIAANQSKNATFSTSTLSNGIYFLTVEANGARTTSRFVVAH